MLASLYMPTVFVVFGITSVLAQSSTSTQHNAYFLSIVRKDILVFLTQPNGIVDSLQQLFCHMDKHFGVDIANKHVIDCINDCNNDGNSNNVFSVEMYNCSSVFAASYSSGMRSTASPSYTLQFMLMAVAIFFITVL
eukprot:jgi/Hompol1/1169/HPOL_005522-RA